MEEETNYVVVAVVKNTRTAVIKKLKQKKRNSIKKPSTHLN
jgi:hypothetical protein